MYGFLGKVRTKKGFSQKMKSPNKAMKTDTQFVEYTGIEPVTF